ncbi:TraB/GumN family protein [Methermicoccus shengliensis]|uniref:TraB/GumN family protein n=1 Tax=Methermicoccus shengliensis TaxID=660064 RepID=A0A832RX84_9EURY|nr:TraB/GumN family protein [Methermicoccus shengliensis]KUK04139.1 MAG: TraB family protein [Euryarchaeota archaeon 55_53]KUK29564.1 MAG: TraB family protein [Methanosarcinales archeaon 56_1174]MDI3487785.1 hypothetical protein [Methanosarcinales archaeon]MDN5294858.1 hypothetical protein [Methanosarcinales archaeon]HIH69878.1 TraB/GumN family protein [Methermicoccus shengliensis]
MSELPTRLLVSGSEIVIVGTAHIREKSVEEVRNVIDSECPDVVALELDPQRLEALLGGERDIPLREVLRKGNVMLVLVELVLAHFQRRLGEQLGVKPGSEMLEAYHASRERGARVVLIDRDVGITLRRFLDRLSLLEKVKILASLVLSFAHREEIDIESITERDMVDYLMRELKAISPSAYEVFVAERDALMAHALLSLAHSGHTKVVAVVGAGHVEGICRYIAHPETLPEVSRLLGVGKKRFPVAKVIAVGLASLVIGAIVYLALSVSLELALWAFVYWFIINGSLSALGAAVARGHPLSVLTAFCVAWFTSLNPFLAAGWFAGLVELWKRSPTTADIKAIVSAHSFSEVLNNRAFRVLAVAALANLGSTAGTFIGAWMLLRMAGIPP